MVTRFRSILVIIKEKGLKKSEAKKYNYKEKLGCRLKIIR